MSKILVVDDDVNIRNSCYDFLSGEGHEVVTYARGTQALENLGSVKPDLVLMDIDIPGEEGLSLLRRMPRAKENRVPVIIFSGNVTQKREKEAYEAGAIEVVRKGVAFEELLGKINKVLQNKDKLWCRVEFKQTAEKQDKGNKILIVDDEETVREFLKDFFESRGYPALVADSGERAIEIVKSEKPEMILLDVNMPGMDGVLTLKKIREIDADVGVVMASGLDDEEIVKETTAHGAYAYVLKPFDIKYLELVVLTRLVISA